MDFDEVLVKTFLSYCRIVQNPIITHINKYIHFCNHALAPQHSIDLATFNQKKREVEIIRKRNQFSSFAMTWIWTFGNMMWRDVKWPVIIFNSFLFLPPLPPSLDRSQSARKIESGLWPTGVIWKWDIHTYTTAQFIIIFLPRKKSRISNKNLILLQAIRESCKSWNKWLSLMDSRTDKFQWKEADQSNFHL